MTVTLLPVDPATRADAVLDNACEIAVQLIRDRKPNAARLILDRAQRYADDLLGGAAC